MALPLIPLAVGAAALGAVYLYSKNSSADSSLPPAQGSPSGVQYPGNLAPPSFSNDPTSTVNQPFWTRGVQLGYPKIPNFGDKPRFFADWKNAATWETQQAYAQSTQNNWDTQYLQKVNELRFRGPLGTPSQTDLITDPTVYYDQAAIAYKAGLSYVAADFLAYANALIFSRSNNEQTLLQWPPRPRA